MKLERKIIQRGLLFCLKNWIGGRQDNEMNTVSPTRGEERGVRWAVTEGRLLPVRRVGRGHLSCRYLNSECVRWFSIKQIRWNPIQLKQKKLPPLNFNFKEGIYRVMGYPCQYSPHLKSSWMTAQRTQSSAALLAEKKTLTFYNVRYRIICEREEGYIWLK